MQIGTSHTAEAKAKISAGKKGVGKSEEAKAKMSAAKRLYWAQKKAAKEAAATTD